MLRFGFLLAAAPLFAQGPAMDLVLLLENTQGVQHNLSANDFHALRAEDRVAVMTFSSKSHVVQAFTSDPDKAAAALRRSRIGVRLPRPVFLSSVTPKTRLFRALMDAAQLYRDLPLDPSRRRVIVLVFGTDDDSYKPTFDELKRTLTTAQIKLYAVAIRRHDFTRAQDPRIQTPPTIPGQHPPVTTDLAPPPETTLKTLSNLVAAVGGEAVSGDAKVSGVFDRARSGPNQPQKLRLVAGEHTP